MSYQSTGKVNIFVFANKKSPRYHFMKGNGGLAEAILYLPVFYLEILITVVLRLVRTFLSNTNVVGLLLGECGELTTDLINPLSSP
jgi:hypothetical protein